MKILLTGATGFLGSHLLKRFINNGDEVIIIKRSTSNIWRIKTIINDAKYYDIDQVNLRQVFEENSNIDVVIHTATCYGRNGESILQIEKTNSLFPLELLELAIQYHCPYFYNTDTLLKDDLNYYALSKKHFVDWGKKFAYEKRIHFLNLKLEHMYGELDDDTKFIPYLIKQCKLNIPEIDLTAGEQRRDFVYIEDIVKIYEFLLKNKELRQRYYEEIEIGTGVSVRVKDVVEQIHHMTKSDSFLNFGAVPYREGECMDFKVDMTKLSELGFSYKEMLKVEQGIAKVLNEVQE